MPKTILVIMFAALAAGALAQTSDAPLSLDLAQQRAQYAREQMAATERKAQAVEKTYKVAQKRFEEAKAHAEQIAKELQRAQAEFAKARERHDQAYKDLTRAYDTHRGSNKRP